MPDDFEDDPSYAPRRGEYGELWRTIQILPERIALISSMGDRIRFYRARYHAVAAATGIPWEIVGAIHMRESGCDFAMNFLNGDTPWSAVTVTVPKGRGPWASWEACAIEMLNEQDRPAVPDAIGVCTFMEGYNGFGYLSRGLNSPYLWAGSNHGIGVGKYTSDGHYDPEAVDDQAGAMTTLYWLIDRGYSTLLEAADSSV